MNKEEIEKAKEHYIFTTKHELDNENKMLKKYIEHLEQKSETLDKVTDKLKEDIETNNFRETLCSEDKGRYYYGKEILNIIEGENRR